mgnify:CR=1 FL=1|jgi:hypothetical protein
MASYGDKSPYGVTNKKNDQYLDILTIRPVPASDDDVVYTVQPQFTHRPDLLAYSVYGTPKLWWVFAQRNMDVLKDPVYDLVAGLEIRLPRQDKLQQFLGY